MPSERPSKTHQFRDGERLSRSWCQKVENFISTFRVLSGGHFIFDGRNAALQLYTKSVWSGRIWFGNELVENFAAEVDWPSGQLQGEYVVVNLIDGTVTWTDDLGTVDNANEQVFHVATSDGNGGYLLNNYTQGDIHARIT